MVEKKIKVGECGGRLEDWSKYKSKGGGRWSNGEAWNTGGGRRSKVEANGHRGRHDEPRGHRGRQVEDGG